LAKELVTQNAVTRINGYLLIGIEEENGFASKIMGVDAGNPDALVRGITESIRGSIAPPSSACVYVGWRSRLPGGGVGDPG
jgi:hypothetical protein